MTAVQTSQSTYSAWWKAYNEAAERHKRHKGVAQTFAIQFVEDLIRKLELSKNRVAIGRSETKVISWADPNLTANQFMAQAETEGSWQFWLELEFSNPNPTFPFAAEAFSLMIPFELSHNGQALQAVQVFSVSVTTKSRGKNTFTISHINRSGFDDLCKFLSEAILQRLDQSVCWELETLGKEKRVIL